MIELSLKKAGPMKTILSFTILLAFVSCGPAPELKRRPMTLIQKDQQVDKKLNLDNSSVAEVLALKYDNKVMLDCDLKIMTGTGETSGVQKTSFSWNLVNTVESSKELSIQVGERTLGAVVKLTTLGMKRSDSAKDAQGIQYEMKHTPFADIQVTWNDTPVTEAEATPTLLMFMKEKFSPEKLIQVYATEMLTKEISCVLNTEINPLYADEWTAVAPVIEEETETQTEATSETDVVVEPPPEET